MSTAKIESMLKSSGYSWTRPRKMVFELLQHQEPQSVRELLERSSGQIDRASLYRTLSLFEELHIVHRVFFGWKHRYELGEQFREHHHHLYCQQCGKIIPIEDTAELDSLLSELTSAHGFRALQHQFEISGLCKSCQK